MPTHRKISEAVYLEPAPGERKKLDGGVGTEGLSGTLALWHLAKFHAHTWEKCRKSPCISETTARRARGEEGHCMTLCDLILWQLANPHENHCQIFKTIYL